MKKLFGVIAIAAIAAAAGWNFCQSQDEMELSGLALVNADALATCETTHGGSCWWENGYRYCCHGGGLGCAPCD